MTYNKSKAKGSRFEASIVDILKKHTELKWYRVPLSGAGHQKGDVYLMNQRNTYTIECKHYADDSISSKLLTGKVLAQNIEKWWEQAEREANEMDNKPLLVFKHDRSKPLVCCLDKPKNVTNYLFWSRYNFYIMVLEEWLEKEKIVFC